MSVKQILSVVGAESQAEDRAASSTAAGEQSNDESASSGALSQDELRRLCEEVRPAWLRRTPVRCLLVYRLEHGVTALRFCSGAAPRRRGGS